MYDNTCLDTILISLFYFSNYIGDFLSLYFYVILCKYFSRFLSNSYHFQNVQNLKSIVAVSFIGGGNRSTRLHR
jgi:hypothetical protein